MVSMNYLLRIAKGASFKKMGEAIDKVHEKCGKWKPLIFLDMVWCIVAYGAGYWDYLMFGFWDMTPAQKNTYLTRVRNKKVQTLMNDDAYSNEFDNKNIFNKRFARFLHRETLDAENCTFEEFQQFIQGKEVVFAKANKGSCGQGIEKLRPADFANTEAMWAYVQEKGFGVLEELVVQHPDMAALHPASVNTMRIVTDVVGDQVHIAYIVVKMGNGAFVDNSGQGGILCAVDPATGKITSPATDDFTEHVYEQHPVTGVSFRGYQLPMVQEAIALVKEAALEVPQIHHVGWDVAIGVDGPLIIEGNDYPGTDLCQLWPHTPNKTGLWPYYRRILGC